MRSLFLAIVAAAAAASAAALSASAAACCSQRPILASCFGFALGGNNSKFLQAAVNSCNNASFTIDNVAGSGGLWTLEGFEYGTSKYNEGGFGVLFNASNQVVTLAAGVTLQALRGFYHGLHSVLVQISASNVALIGEGGNALQMWKQDYNNLSAYVHSEWRHGVAISRAHGVALSGFAIENTGGDGIDICCSTTDVFVRDVHSVGANRNGMSLTGVSNLTVLDSSFTLTSGTCCMSGLDLEPEVLSEVCNDVTFRNVTFAGNAMNQVTLSLYGQAGVTDNISFENCTVGNGSMAGFYIGGYTSAGPLGTLKLSDVVIRDLGGAGFFFQRNSSTGQAVQLTDVTISGTASAVYSMYGHWPLEIDGGGVTLTRVVVNDAVERPFLYGGWSKPFFASDVSGDVTVNSNNSASCAPYFFNASSARNAVKVTCNAARGSGSGSGSDAALRGSEAAGVGAETGRQEHCLALPRSASRQLAPQRGAQRNAEPYSDPATGCMAGETAVDVPGIAGSFCSPACDAVSNACPPAPNGTYRSTGECVLRFPGQWKPMNCALVCDPDAAVCPGKVPGNMSAGSVCIAAQGYGLCSYHSGCTVWPGSNCTRAVL